MENQIIEKLVINLLEENEKLKAKIEKLEKENELLKNSRSIEPVIIPQPNPMYPPAQPFYKEIWWLDGPIAISDF